ncbi:P2-related tail formation protein [Cupriavidus metallidurans]|uniref:hypothetical protein n=1 Tax=Cupriavidus metallidurans TaxID=119219 RepID=UPI0004936187|nr:hypothetical protein [Cupriavidus metallidurans]MDE4918310.1 hypothetical protein [Cupriavidus metallidurans]
MCAIERLVELNGGPVAVARALDDVVAYQEVQRWVKRGYGAPKHFQRLVALLPQGMAIDDLFADMPSSKGRKLGRKGPSAADSHHRAAA